MSVKIRLKKIGRKKQPTYRIVVIDSHNPLKGAEIENLGSYTPYKKDKPLKLDLQKVAEWQSKGAKPSDAVIKLIKRAKSGNGKPKPEKSPAASKSAPDPVRDEKPIQPTESVEPAETETLSELSAGESISEGES